MQKSLPILSIFKTRGCKSRRQARRCHGELEPVGAEIDSKKGYVIIFKCKKCGKIRRNKAAEDDNMDLIIKLTAMHNY